MTIQFRIIKLFFFTLTLLVLVRLAHWQLVRGSQLKNEAFAQRITSLDLYAARGQILASDHFPLASNMENYLLYLDTNSFKPAADTISFLTQALASDSAKILSNLGHYSTSYLPLTRKLTGAQKLLIEQHNIPGLAYQLQPIRFYPEGSSSAHLLGFAGKDSAGLPKGYFGLEGFYDRELAGKNGRLIEEHDAFNHPIALGLRSELQPVDGRTLVTSIDRTLQYLIYTKLLASLQKYNAPSGTVTVMEPQTGRILALVSLPNYDPSSYENFTSSLFKNPIVADSYEPGSTFKVVVMASALDAKAISPTTRCTTCDKAIIVSGHAVKTHDDIYHPNSTLSEIIQNSDNVGMVFVQKKLGNHQIVSYLKSFGIGSPTGVDLEDENVPQLRPDNQWVDIDYATASFGQGIAVTPLQLVRAVGAIANQGKLVTPHLVDQIVAPDFTKTLSYPQPVQVVSPEAAIQVTQMMVDAVDYNKVGWTRPPGYKIAAKSGTAQIPIAGHYDEDKTIGSFIGFAPAYNPKFVMLVTISEPKSSPWGSRTAAPLWFDIATEILRFYKVRPE